jgi:hypothetical protein
MKTAASRARGQPVVRTYSTGGEVLQMMAPAEQESRGR